MNSTKMKSSFRIADILESDTTKKSDERSQEQSYERSFLGKPIIALNKEPFVTDTRSRYYSESMEELLKAQRMSLLSNLRHVPPFAPVNLSRNLDMDYFHSNLMKGEY